jgi:transposase
MKKISTAAAKQSKNFSEQKLTIGLDLGDRNSWYCVLDERGEVVLEQRLGTTPKAMREAFGGMPGSRIALETGMHSPWVSRVLSELGHEVIVAHARNVRLIGESRRKDGRRDARTLARLARIDPQLLCPAKHRSAKAQADLTVIRAGAGLVRARTALVNAARGLAAQNPQLRRAKGGGREGDGMPVSDTRDFASGVRKVEFKLLVIFISARDCLTNAVRVPFAHCVAEGRSVLS